MGMNELMSHPNIASQSESESFALAYETMPHKLLSYRATDYM